MFRTTFFYNIVFFLIAFSGIAQEGVKTPVANKKEITGKFMIVPFEPKMYMSEFDQKFNEQTKWNFNQIREYFRHQLDNQLKLKFQSIQSPVVSFYNDSIKTTKDLDYIYKSTTISFDLLDKPTAPTEENKKQTGIKNGQIVVEVSNDKKFTNVKTSNNELIPYLNKKYKSEYFIFINELDFKSLPDSYNAANDTYQREVVVHYTIIDKNSKLITAGAATAKFTSKDNHPKKIAALVFPAIASYIATKFTEAVGPTKTN
jgi:hypothetical protein